MNTYLVYSKVLKDGKQWFLTENRVEAFSKESAKQKITALGNREVTSVVSV
jgi:hypothetical protein